jgi:muramoyltetrapeptide carboxypeptidase LdcA involved in peptidoglycan recycling
MCYRAGVSSFYGPSILAGFAENTGIPRYLADAVRRTLFSTDPPGPLVSNPHGWTDEFLDWADPSNQDRPRRYELPMAWQVLQGRGTVRGRLLGGCIEVLEWLRGTSLWPDDRRFDAAILFLETSEEAPSPRWVARQLRTYAAMGILHRLGAILFGRPGGRVPPPRFAEYDEWIRRVVCDEHWLTELPIVTRMDFGHTDPTFVLPYGVEAELDCDAGTFSILESAVASTWPARDC